MPANLVRWGKSNQLHVTLKFFGDVPVSRLEELNGELKRVCAAHRPFLLVLEQLGCFPNVRSPRVIWMGLAGDLEKLASLQRAIEKDLRGFGDHLEERDSHPHLTLGRVRAETGRTAQVGAAIERAEVGRLGEWMVNEIDLLQSELLPDGARYTRLATFELRRES